MSPASPETAPPAIFDPSLYRTSIIPFELNLQIRAGTLRFPHPPSLASPGPSWPRLVPPSLASSLSTAALAGDLTAWTPDVVRLHALLPLERWEELMHDDRVEVAGANEWYRRWKVEGEEGAQREVQASLERSERRMGECLAPHFIYLKLKAAERSHRTCSSPAAPPSTASSPPDSEEGSPASSSRDIPSAAPPAETPPARSLSTLTRRAPLRAHAEDGEPGAVT